MLCGGASRRMGTDKALLRVGRVALARRVADALAAAGADPVIAVGGDRDALAALGLAVVADRWPGEGPLGGLITALGAVPAGVVVVAGCDHPALDPSAIRSLVAALVDDPGAGAATALADGRRLPLPVAVRTTAAPLLADRFGAGARSLRAGLEAMAVVDVPGVAADAVADVDRPADLGPLASSTMDVPEIDIDELARRREAGPVRLIDVRQPDEYAEARVPGAVLVPLGEVPDRLAEVPAGGEVLVICAGGSRSLKAAEFYRGQGIEAVNVAGGTKAWVESGRPYDTGS